MFGMRKWTGRAVAIATGVVVAGAAQAAPAASTPSVARVGDPVALAGHGFKARSVVSVRVIEPDGRVQMSATTVQARGALEHTLTPARPGRYTVELLDANNRVIARSAFLAVPN